MSTSTTNYFRLGNLTGMSQVDMESDDDSPLQRPGTIVFNADAFGYKIFQYIQNKRGSALALGALSTRAALVDATVTTGTTTVLTTSGLTANAHDGKMIHCRTTTANAAPEGETSQIASNPGTTTINLDPNFPYSAANTTSTTHSIIATYHGIASAVGDRHPNILGIVVGQSGITDTQFGWVQKEGPVVALIGTGVLTVGNYVKPQTAAVQDGGDSSLTLTQVTCNVGYSLATSATSQTRGQIYVNLFASTV